jgi:hypothetical protein
LPCVGIVSSGVARVGRVFSRSVLPRNRWLAPSRRTNTGFHCLVVASTDVLSRKHFAAYTAVRAAFKFGVDEGVHDNLDSSTDELLELGAERGEGCVDGGVYSLGDRRRSLSTLRSLARTNGQMRGDGEVQRSYCYSVAISATRAAVVGVSRNRKSRFRGFL